MDTETKFVLNKENRTVKLPERNEIVQEKEAAKTYRKYKKDENKVKKIIRSSLDAINLDKKTLKQAKTIISSLPDKESKENKNKEHEIKKSITLLLRRNKTIKQNQIHKSTNPTSKLTLNQEQAEKEEFKRIQANVGLSAVEVNVKAHNIPFLALKRSYAIDRQGVKKFYVPLPKEDSLRSTTDSAPRTLMAHKNVFDSVASWEELEISSTEEGCLLIYPDSNFKVGWDLFVFALTLYILLTLPLSMAFGLFETDFYNKLDFVIDILFVVDLSFNFLIPYQDLEENLVCNYRLIARHYLSSWFLVDLVSSIPVAIILNFMDEESTDIRFSRFTRLTKLYKLFKFLKVLFIVKVFKKRKVDKKKKVKTVSENSTETSKEFRLAVSFLIFSIVIHILTCFWIMLATYEDLNWTIKLKTTTNVELYVHSLYFNLATILTVGYGDVVPVSTLERVYSLFMMMFGILTYSFAISQISLIVTGRDLFTENYIKRLEILESIKKDHNISWKHYDKIEKFLNYSSKINKKENYEFIKELPPNVREMLLFNMYETLINKLSFLAEKNKEFIVRFIFMVKPYRSYYDEYLLHQGDKVKEMILVENGKLAFLLGPKFNFLKVIDLHKYESFGDFLVFTGERAPVNIVCKCKKTDLFFLGKDALEDLRTEFPSEMKQNMAISTYNYMSLVDIIEIKLAKVLSYDSSSVVNEEEFSSIIKPSMIQERRQSYEEVSTGEHIALKNVMEEESLARFSSGSVRVFEEATKMEGVGDTRVARRASVASRLAKKIEDRRKSTVDASCFLKMELASHSKKQTIKKNMSELRKMLSELRTGN